MRKAGEVLDALLKDRFGHQFVERARSTAGLFSAWADITDKVWSSAGTRREEDDFSNDKKSAAASHSRVREFEKGALLVEADHPGWVQILQTKQQELLSAARRRFPELDIRSLSFCLSREPFSFSATLPSNLEPVPPQQSEPDKNNGPGNGSYYDALKKLETSVKERKNDQT